MDKQTETTIQARNPVQQAAKPAITNTPIKPRKAIKKWLAITIILILVLSVPIEGYYLLGKMGIHPKPSKVTITTPTATPNSTTSDFANWKTYTNNEIGYSVKYPSAWYTNGNDIYTLKTTGVGHEGMDNGQFKFEVNKNEYLFLLCVFKNALHFIAGSRTEDPAWT